MSTAPQGWQNPKTNWQAADIVHPSDVNRIEGNIQAIEGGQRTLDPSQVPNGNQGTLRQMLDWFANRIRAITGGTNWWDAPAITLAAAAAHAARTDNPHNVQAPQVPYSSGVAGFSPANVKAALDRLASVRIVEMGSNANGTYVRWENGLQVCWRSRLTLPRVSGTQAYATWTFPARFLNTDYSVLITQAWSSGDSPANKPTMVFTHSRTTSECSARLISKDSDLADGESWGVHLVAIGRWK